MRQERDARPQIGHLNQMGSFRLSLCVSYGGEGVMLRKRDVEENGD